MNLAREIFSNVTFIGERQQCLQTDFMDVYSWGNNVVDCKKNRAFTVGNIYIYFLVLWLINHLVQKIENL